MSSTGMSRHKVLRAFPLSRDGVCAVELQQGSVEDIPDALAPGLMREGFIGPEAESEALPLSADAGPAMDGPAEQPPAAPVQPDQEPAPATLPGSRRRRSA